MSHSLPNIFSPRSPDLLASPNDLFQANQHSSPQVNGTKGQYYDPEDEPDRSTDLGHNRDGIGHIAAMNREQSLRETRHTYAAMNRWDPDASWQRRQAPVERYHLTVRETNVPDRHELFLLQDEEKKVEVETISSVPNSALFTFNREDHTLGNLLRSRLLASPHVVFAGYKVPHPLFPTFQLRIQTDGSVTPKDALVIACQDVVRDLASLGREFTKEWELKKMIGDAQNGTD